MNRFSKAILILVAVLFCTGCPEPWMPEGNATRILADTWQTISLEGERYYFDGLDPETIYEIDMVEENARRFSFDLLDADALEVRCDCQSRSYPVILPEGTTTGYIEIDSCTNQDPSTNAGRLMLRTVSPSHAHPARCSSDSGTKLYSDGNGYDSYKKLTILDTATDLSGLDLSQVAFLEQIEGSGRLGFNHIVSTDLVCSSNLSTSALHDLSDVQKLYINQWLRCTDSSEFTIGLVCKNPLEVSPNVEETLDASEQVLHVSGLDPQKEYVLEFTHEDNQKSLRKLRTLQGDVVTGLFPIALDTYYLGQGNTDLLVDLIGGQEGTENVGSLKVRQLDPAEVIPTHDFTTALSMSSSDPGMVSYGTDMFLAAYKVAGLSATSGYEMNFDITNCDPNFTRVYICSSWGYSSMSQSYADGTRTNGSVEYFVFVLKAADGDHEALATFSLSQPSML